MFNSQILEIAIGLMFVFLIASLLASALREIVESLLKTRAIQLERGIRLLLDDPTGAGATSKVFAHSQIFCLFDGVYDPSGLTTHWRFWKKARTLDAGKVLSSAAVRLPFGSKFPSYIPSRNFAMALLDLVGRHGTDAPEARSPNGSASIETLIAHANALAPSRVREALLLALNEAQGDFDRARTSLEAWFDSNMDRVSGWYKRESQVVLLVIGMASAVLFNIDTVSITRQLASNNTVRAQVVLQAEAARKTINDGAQARPDGDPLLDAQALADARKGLGDLLGWPEKMPQGWHLGQAIAGWMLTAIAISLGAPFWFDLLNKMMVIRATVKPYEKSPAEGSDDRAGATPSAERLEPQPQAGGAPMVSSGATVGISGPPTGSLRLAVDPMPLSDLALTIDGQPVAVPRSGMADLPLVLGRDHLVALTAKRVADGMRVSFSQVVRLTLVDDAKAIDAELA